MVQVRSGILRTSALRSVSLLSLFIAFQTSRVLVFGGLDGEHIALSRLLATSLPDLLRIFLFSFNCSLESKGRPPLDCL